MDDDDYDSPPKNVPRENSRCATAARTELAHKNKGGIIRAITAMTCAMGHELKSNQRNEAKKLGDNYPLGASCAAELNRS